MVRVLATCIRTVVAFIVAESEGSIAQGLLKKEDLDSFCVT